MPVKKSAKRPAKKSAAKKGGAMAEGLAATGILLAARAAYKNMNKPVYSPPRNFKKKFIRGGFEITSDSSPETQPPFEEDVATSPEDMNIPTEDVSTPPEDMNTPTEDTLEELAVKISDKIKAEPDSANATADFVEKLANNGVPISLAYRPPVADQPTTAAETPEQEGGRPFRFHRRPEDAECTLDKAFRRLLDEYYKFRNASTAPAAMGSPKAATAAPGSPKAKTATPKAATAAPGSPKAKTATPKAATAAMGSPKAKTATPKMATAMGSPKAKTATPKMATAMGSPKAKTATMGLASKPKTAPAAPTPTLWQGGDSSPAPVDFLAAGDGSSPGMSLPLPGTSGAALPAATGFSGGALKKKTKSAKKSASKKPKSASKKPKSVKKSKKSVKKSRR